jgi:hypothetical protein
MWTTACGLKNFSSPGRRPWRPSKKVYRHTMTGPEKINASSPDNVSPKIPSTTNGVIRGYLMVDSNKDAPIPNLSQAAGNRRGAQTNKISGSNQAHTHHFDVRVLHTNPVVGCKE